MQVELVQVFPPTSCDEEHPPHPASYYLEVHSSSTRDYLYGNTHITGNRRSSDDAITGAWRGWAIKSANI